MLLFGHTTEIDNKALYYLHPSYQVSNYVMLQLAIAARPSVNILYASNLLSSESQKRSVRDLWGLPRIPQWRRDMAEGKAYDVDQDAIGRGDVYYASLLGIPIRGLDFANGSTQYDFWLETSYLDFDCALVGTRLGLADYTRHIPGGELNLTQAFDKNNQNNSTPSRLILQVQDLGEAGPSMRLHLYICYTLAYNLRYLSSHLSLIPMLFSTVPCR